MVLETGFSAEQSVISFDIEEERRRKHSRKTKASSKRVLKISSKFCRGVKNYGQNVDFLASRGRS